MRKKVYVFIVMLLVMLEVTGLFFMYKSTSDNETQLDSVKLKEIVNDKDMFAIMLEQDDGTYAESTDSTWPTNMQYNAEKSGCVDINGNKLDGVLTFDSENNLASVDTTSTSYCYLYFSIPKWCNEDETAAECLLRNPTSGLSNTSMEAGMYRYQGNSGNNDVVNNYVCFGTSSQSDCLENTDKYLYRIIGITESGQMKLIKNTSIGSKAWHNNYTDNTTWPDSDLFKALNGDPGTDADNPIAAIFVDNSIYDYMAKDSTWYNKIATTSWKYGDTTSNGSYDGATIYATENGWTNTVSAKVSLMYIHDYYYAYGVGGAPGSYSNAKTAWLHISNCASSTNEWTMSRYGLFSSSYYARHVYSDGDPVRGYVTSSYAVRPVFYLNSSVEIVDGTGLSDDPFVLN